MQRPQVRVSDPDILYSIKIWTQNMNQMDLFSSRFLVVFAVVIKL